MKDVKKEERKKIPPKENIKRKPSLITRSNVEFLPLAKMWT
jgi:hypothetical protein